MARRVKNVERDFLFQLTNGASDSVSVALYIDSMQNHALVNRISTRQGYNVMIESLEIGVQQGGSFTASILRLPQTWACVNAWTKTMALWKQQQDEKAEESDLESTIARYRDFKIHFDEAHQDAGFAANLIAEGYVTDDGGSTTDSYNWAASEVVIPNDTTPGNTTERHLHMIGDDVGSTSAGMIKAYAESRSRPQQTDPNIVDVASGGLFGEMFDVGDDSSDIVTNLQDRNAQPPYLMGLDSADEYYPGGSFQGIGPQQASGGAGVPGQFVDTLAVNANQNFNSDSTGSFLAPCGLIKILVEATGVGISPGPVRAGEMVGGPLWLRLRLAPGYYQGIAAVPMQEAN